MDCTRCKNRPKKPKIGQNGPKMGKNQPKMAQNGKKYASMSEKMRGNRQRGEKLRKDRKSRKRDFGQDPDGNSVNSAEKGCQVENPEKPSKSCQNGCIWAENRKNIGFWGLENRKIGHNFEKTAISDRKWTQMGMGNILGMTD